MNVRRAWINEYVAQLNGLAAKAQGALKKALESIDVNDPGAREAIMEIMNDICGWSTDQAANMATIFYDGLREIQLGEPYGAEPYSGRDPSATYTATAGILNGEPTAVENALMNRISYEMKRAAGNCVIWNTHRERQVGVGTVGYARVTNSTKSYADGCPFCKMLSSRGFVYHDEESAGGEDPDHYHADCNCSIVPSWSKDTTVQDYNPDKEWDDWKQWVEDTAVARSQKNGTTVDAETRAIYANYSTAATEAHKRHGSNKSKPNPNQRYVK